MNQPSPENPAGPADRVGQQPGPYAQPGPHTPDGGYPPGPPRPNVTGRVLGTVGGVLALAMVGFGALFLVDLSMSETTTTHRSYDAVDTVVLRTDGDVTVSAAEGDVEVDVIAHSGLREPTYSDVVSASALEINHRCGWSFMLPRCSGELDVTLPAGTRVVVRTENGDVVASGLADDVALNTRNGRVEAKEISGPLDIGSSNGDIGVMGAGAGVRASTSNGRIDIVDVDGMVIADSSNGDITIGTVTGDASATSSNGSVEISDVGGDVYGVTSNGQVAVIGDGEPVALTIETSNGDEIIQGPTDPDAERSVEIRSSNGDVAYLDE
ncbi:DUF4097 family beta strand repeat-containing protein [Promicromonospora soli]